MRAAVKKSLIAGVTIGSVGLAAAVMVPAFAGPKTVEVATVAGGTGVAGQYIVTMKSAAATQDKASRYGATDQYRSALNGFTAKLNAKQLETLKKDPSVAAIEQDQIMKATTTQKAPLPWGLDRIDQKALPLSKSYTYKLTGAGIPVYVIDTGINASHKQFGGRASSGGDFVGDGQNGADCNGHGTHVAGTIGSGLHGVAKKASLISVRVLDCNGEGYLSDIIAGVNWVAANHQAKAIANVSLGGPKSAAFNSAVTALSNSGVFVAVAAGNDNKNACNTSPASAGSVEAVGATTGSDYRASFSNFGSCVDIHAPGVNITSTWIGSTTAQASISGTSMASPHVAGVAALLKQHYGQKPFSSMQKWLHTYALKNKIKGNKSGTANRILYKGTI